LQEKNNFNSMRLWASLAVLVSHGFPLATGKNLGEPVHRFSHGQTTLGTIAVTVFFAISGYLITRSFIRSRDPLKFMIARVLRLYPALIAVLVVLAFGLGPLLTTLSLAGYMEGIKPARYVAGNLLFVGVDNLPGVFEHLPFRNAVNGSLWTLRYEVACYGIVLALGVTRLLRWEIALALLLACVADRWIGRLGVYSLFGLPFATGSLMMLANLPRRAWAAMLCAAASVVSLRVGGFELISGTMGAYAIVTFGAAYGRVLRDPVPLIGDLSFGIYVWAYPIEQLSAWFLGSAASWWAIVLLSVGPTLAFAWLN
jgi:peptidoglycan/LPS O-acetylase OafA/YrhL